MRVLPIPIRSDGAIRLFGNIWRKVARWFHRDPPVLTLPQFEPPPVPTLPQLPKRHLDYWDGYDHSCGPIVTAPLANMQLPEAPQQAAPTVQEVASDFGLNRRDRRRLERARRKHDKFVTPKGPEPTHFPREPAPEKEKQQATVEPKVEMPFDDPNDMIIADEWLEGDGSEVLYEQSEFLGEFNFRDSILEQLDRYWIYLERMRRHDGDAYQFYKRIGATLLPYAASASLSDKAHPIKQWLTPEEVEKYKAQIVLPSYFRTHWPAFGCVAFGTNPRDEKAELDSRFAGKGRVLWIPKFMYFRRIYRMPWTVQPVRKGYLYMLTVWWDRPHDKGYRRRWGVPMEFPVQIDPDGEHLRVLKTRQDGEHSNVRAEFDWRIPHEYRDWSKQHGLDPQTHLTHMFCNAVKYCEYTNYSMVRVAVSKGDLTAVFGISPRRTSYFFQDRDYTLTVNGRRERIFHMVRAHMRNGVAVPTKFRGLREFEWAGYHVKLTVPGRDHFMLPDFSVPLRYDEDHKLKRSNPNRWLTETEIAQMLDGWIKEGRGSTH